MKKYSCKNCNAELYWDGQEKCLKCEYCNSKYLPSDCETKEIEINRLKRKKDKNKRKINNKKETNINTIKDIPESAEKTAIPTDESISSDLVVYKCTECGAEIITARSTIATTCAYCGRAISLTNKLIGNFKPDYVIPFKYNEEDAQMLYKKYCNKSILAPKHFKNKAEIKKIKGIYVPFWLHSFQNETNANLHCENTTTRRSGDDKIIIKHQYQVNIDAVGYFEKIPTDALKYLDNKLMDALEPFNYDEMKEFNPAYMAGYYAEEFNETDEITKKRATERADAAMKEEILKKVGNYEKKAIIFCNHYLENYQSAYVMLPIFLLNTEYKKKKYTFAINGNTGKITGKLPLSIFKVITLGISIFLIINIIIMLAKLFL